MSTIIAIFTAGLIGVFAFSGTAYSADAKKEEKKVEKKAEKKADKKADKK